MNKFEEFVVRNCVLATEERVGELAEELRGNEVIETSFDLNANRTYANELINSAIWLWALSLGWGMVGAMALMISLSSLTALEGAVAGAISVLLFFLCGWFTATAVKITHKVRLVKADVKMLEEELARVTFEQNATGVICHR